MEEFSNIIRTFSSYPQIPAKTFNSKLCIYVKFYWKFTPNSFYRVEYEQSQQRDFQKLTKTKECKFEQVVTQVSHCVHKCSHHKTHKFSMNQHDTSFYHIPIRMNLNESRLPGGLIVMIILLNSFRDEPARHGRATPKAIGEHWTSATIHIKLIGLNTQSIYPKIWEQANKIRNQPPIRRSNQRQFHQWKWKNSWKYCKWVGAKNNPKSQELPRTTHPASSAWRTRDI